MTSEKGIALVIVLLLVFLLSTIAAAVMLSAGASSLVAANGGASIEAYYAAEAVFERTSAELRRASSFTQVLNGTVVSAFVDGPPGVRQLPDGAQLDLSQVVNFANCAKRNCTDTDMSAVTPDRPWGTRNPRWRLFSYGPLDAATGTPWSSVPLYIVSLVADDPSDADDDPWQDGGRTASGVNPGAGILWVRGEAFGRRGAHRAVEGAVVRLDLVAAARWQAADPATRGAPPVAVPVLRRLFIQEVR